MTPPSWQPSADRQIIIERALMLKNIRAFFEQRSVLEVETPLLSHHSTTDPHLDSLQTHFREQICFLNTSPEYAMKRLLARLQSPVFQICKAFRDDESGAFHNPEFTLLEWYRPGFSYHQLMDELESLIRELCDRSQQFRKNDMSFQRLSYRQAFEQALGIDPHQVTSSECFEIAHNSGIEIPQGLTIDDAVDDWLDWLLTQRVLPGFPTTGFTFLCDYPVSQCSLAKINKNSQGDAIAMRFELFYGEIELANGFQELTDAAEQLQRFKQENISRKQRGKQYGRIDTHLIEALEAGLPECSGLALGLDRFLMVLAGVAAIDQVLAFAWSRS